MAGTQHKIDGLFEWDLRWEEEVPQGSAGDATWGQLQVRVRDKSVWGTDQSGVRWTWVELLEHLSWAWPALFFEDGWPPDLHLASTGDYDRCVKVALKSVKHENHLDREQEFFEFRNRHDLGRGLHGTRLPPWWIVRIGNHVVFGTLTDELLLERQLAFSALEKLGDVIAERIGHLSDKRAKEAVADWKKRMAVPAAERITFLTGIEIADLHQLTDGSLLEAFEVDKDNFSETELLVVARMSVGVEIETGRKILRLVRQVPVKATPELEKLRLAAEPYVQVLEQRGLSPAEQGYLLALWVRRHVLNLSDDDPVNPGSMLEEWGVHLAEVRLNSANIEAVACWGPRHGPAVLVNLQGKHSRSRRGRRATLSHEIAHLILDRRAGLPLADVLGGNVHRPIEQRANSFAAELLMPQAVAGAEMRVTMDPGRVLKRLARRYEASHEVIAWQARNSGRKLSKDVKKVLRARVSQPSRF